MKKKVTNLENLKVSLLSYYRIANHTMKIIPTHRITKFGRYYIENLSIHNLT